MARRAILFGIPRPKIVAICSCPRFHFAIIHFFSDDKSRNLQAGKLLEQKVPNKVHNLAMKLGCAEQRLANPSVRKWWKLSFLILFSLLAASCTRGARTRRVILPTGGEQIVHITFTRSGGLVAAPGMNIEAAVELKESGGKVSANGDRYQRDLTPVESKQLLATISPARFFQLGADLRPPNAQNDQYQFDITVEDAAGKQHQVTLGGNQTTAELNTLAPGLGNLLDWIRQETDNIWQHRVQQR